MIQFYLITAEKSVVFFLCRAKCAAGINFATGF